MIAYLIPDMPEWVEIAVASADYQSKLAFKRQVTVYEAFSSTLHFTYILDSFLFK